MHQENTSMHKVFFKHNTFGKWIHPKSIARRPRVDWTEETMREIYDIINEVYKSKIVDSAYMLGINMNIKCEGGTMSCEMSMEPHIN